MRHRRPTFEPVEPRVLFAGATIQGIAWSDFDNDGVIESGEPLLPGLTLFLDANHNNRLDAGETSTVTAANGAYAFTNLPAGNYLIGAVPKPGYNPAAPPQPAPAAVPSATVATPAPPPQSNLAQYTAADLDTATGWVVGLTPGASISAVSSRAGATNATPTGVLPDTYLLHFPASATGAQAAATLTNTPGLSFFYPLVPRAQQSRFVPNDTYFNQQWHLKNTGQTGGTPGNDVNVTPVWDNFQGQGVTVGVVDDGVQYAHPDLAPNYDAADSYDFNQNDADPAPLVSNQDFHGTSVAGVVAARGNNALGVSGVAPQARFAAIRLTAFDTTDVQEAAALAYHRDQIAIYSNSWGPSDDGETLEGPGPLTLAALRDAVTLGRNGKGNVYVWAAGNGGGNDDNVNYDGYANSRYVIAVTSVDDRGDATATDEDGAPILVSAPSKGAGQGITTTDYTGSTGFGTGDYISYFEGTSASAPIVSGVVALMLQANPNLGWRDVKQILLNTARKNDPTDADWSQNGAGHWVNHHYGFGAVDANAAVQAALNWTNLAPETLVSSGPIDVNQAIPDNNSTGLSSAFTVNQLVRAETVEVEFTATHSFRGNLRVVLTSPDGTKSVLAQKHGDDGDDYDHWIFTTNRHWDEVAKGTWTLKVTDAAGGNVGTWVSWELNVYGTPITNEHYVPLAANATVTGKNFSARPLPGAKVSAAAQPLQGPSQRLSFTFDRDVPAANLNASDLELFNQTTGQTLAAPFQLQYNAATRTATWTFPAYARALLPDGNYTARLKAADITLANGGMLDGNGDNFGGDDFTLSFFQLAGDANRDRTVNAADRKAAMYNQGAANPTLAQGDVNYDGQVDFGDFQLIELAYNHSLPAPAEPVSIEPESASLESAPAPTPVPAKAAPKPIAAAASKPAPVIKPPPPARPAPAFCAKPIRRDVRDLLR